MTNAWVVTASLEPEADAALAAAFVSEATGWDLAVMSDQTLVVRATVYAANGEQALQTFAASWRATTATPPGPVKRMDAVRGREKYFYMTFRRTDGLDSCGVHFDGRW